MAVPADCPVITPVTALIEAIEVSDEAQTPFVIVDEKVVVNPTQIFWMPVNIPALAAGKIVNVTAVLEFEGQF